MPGNSPIATCRPTPVRKPTSTVRERKSARNASRASRAASRRAAVSSASTPASATHCGEDGVARATSDAAMMAAVAESAPTTSMREDPNTTNSTAGTSSVYRPVTTGVPEMRV